MILAFKPQFKEPILNGTKIHTIRMDKTNRWQKGKQIHFATGVRTKNYNCFKLGFCKRVETVYMSYAFNDVIEITVGGNYLFGFAEKLEFAKNDGFETWQQFFDWFYPLIKATEDNFLTCKLIHWTDNTYRK